MKLSKVVTLIIGLVVIAFGILKPGTIFEINLFAFAGMGIFVVPVMFGMYWKKATLPAAFASVITGIIVLISLTSIPAFKPFAFGFHPLLPASVVTALVMVIVSLCTKTPSEAIINKHFSIFKKVNKQEA